MADSRPRALIEIIRDLWSFDGEAVICAREPLTADSEATVAVGDPEYDDARGRGFVGYMRVWMAREHLEGWFENVPERPSLTEQCDRLIHYFLFDA